MVVDLLDAQTMWRLILIGILCVMFSAVGYAIGHKDGSREGFTRGRAVSRHASREVK
jgi:putative Mn2+ efflux pump MntP